MQPSNSQEPIAIPTQAGNVWLVPIVASQQGTWAAGSSKREAIENAAKQKVPGQRVIHCLPFPMATQVGRAEVRYPMLITGATHYLTERLPHEILKHYDVHLLFMPSNESMWHCSLTLVGKSSPEILTITEQGKNIQEVMQGLMHRTIIEFRNEIHILGTDAIPDCPDESDLLKRTKTVAWLNLWLKRGPKIPFRDVIHLESYE